MEEKYIKEKITKDKTEKEKEDELIKSIIKTKNMLNESHYNFEYAEKDLVDYYIYQIKANQTKLDYLMKVAKMKKIKNVI